MLANTYASCDPTNIYTFYHCFPNTDETYLVRTNFDTTYKPNGYSTVTYCCTAYTNYFNYSSRQTIYGIDNFQFAMSTHDDTWFPGKVP